MRKKDFQSSASVNITPGSISQDPSDYQFYAGMNKMMKAQQIGASSMLQYGAIDWTKYNKEEKKKKIIRRKRTPSLKDWLEIHSRSL